MKTKDHMQSIFSLTPNGDLSYSAELQKVRSCNVTL